MDSNSEEQGSDGSGVEWNVDQPGLLTPAEFRVLARMPTHLPLAAVAEDLHVSRETVKSHVRSIYRKLGVGDRLGVVEVARRAGLLEPGDVGDTRLR